jgi:hypothetical protein
MDMVSFLIINEPDPSIALRFIKAFPTAEILPHFESEMKKL